MMKTTLSLIAASVALLGGIFSPAIPALAYPPPSTTAAGNTTGIMPAEPNLHDFNSTMNADEMWMMFGQMKFGMISSIQNNDQGQPGWIASGYWVLRNDTGASNTTNSSGSNIANFYAMFHMAMLDGSALHSHEIYNFTQSGNSSFDASDNSTTVTGTATVTLREGPVNDVGTTIRISNDHVIAISLDPGATGNHFGNTPIYGMAVTPEMLGSMSMGMNTSSPMGSMNGTMNNNWTGNNSTNGMMYGGMPK
jgi:hypothetical protein